MRGSALWDVSVLFDVVAKVIELACVGTYFEGKKLVLLTPTYNKNIDVCEMWSSRLVKSWERLLMVVTDFSTASAAVILRVEGRVSVRFTKEIIGEILRF